MKINCIVCNKEMKNWDEAYPDESNRVHPLDGTVFRTYGNYGSSVFDPMDSTFLEITICDPCLESKLDRTYEGVDEEYKEEINKKQAEMDALLDKLNLMK
jgi:uncharacterized protein (DUF2225 family)